ncbi:MAG TPA: DUF2934 domain-containing protein [Candidatus Acidoferrum sp.]|nr:DUF2934 domain-containing protein [Candidatus Acidoferrum sp.]
MGKYPDEQIRNYAQRLWEKAGRPEGKVRRILATS